jgi:hypothetical protein
MALLAVAGLLWIAGAVQAGSLTDSLRQGTPPLKSIGALAFGPEGILFLADPREAAVLAIDTQDRTPATSTDRPQVEDVNEKMASLLGIEARQLKVNDLAVNPISGNVYLSAMRGSGAESQPVLLRVDRGGKLADVPLRDVRFSRVTLSNPAQGQQQRQDVITHMAYVDGKLIVAGLSNEEFASQLRLIPVPFKESTKGAGVEIYHGSHGRLETRSPVRTFVPFEVKGESNLLAAYTCTPLVQVPLAQLEPGKKVKGKTVAELGNGNRPLDMIVYEKDGKQYLLLANNKRGVMKIRTEGIDQVEAITAHVRGVAGLPYDTIAGLDGTVELDRFDKDHAVILRKKGDHLSLETVSLP